MAWQEGDIGFFEDLPEPIDLDDDVDVDELDFESHAKRDFDWMEGYNDD